MLLGNQERGQWAASLCRRGHCLAGATSPLGKSEKFLVESELEGGHSCQGTVQVGQQVQVGETSIAIGYLRSPPPPTPHPHSLTGSMTKFCKHMFWYLGAQQGIDKKPSLHCDTQHLHWKM